MLNGPDCVAENGKTWCTPEGLSLAGLEHAAAVTHPL